MNCEKIKLRALEPDDIERLYQWENDTEIWKYTNTLVPVSKFDLEQFVLSSDKDPYKQKQVRFIIDVMGNEGKVSSIGTADLFEFEPRHRRAGVGIMITKKARRNHFATMALEQLIKYAFEVLNLHQLFCNIALNNDYSIALFKKLGFEKSGIKKEWLFEDNKWTDEIMMQLLNKDKQVNKQ